MDRLPQAAFGEHLRISWGQGNRQLLLLGHMDTVWPMGEAQRRPFRVSHDKATGPGAFDMKGGLVIALYAVMALQELGLRPVHRLVFLFNSDEEVGSLTSRPLIEEEARAQRGGLWCWNRPATVRWLPGAKGWDALSWRSKGWLPTPGQRTSEVSALCRSWPIRSYAWRP